MKKSKALLILAVLFFHATHSIAKSIKIDASMAVTHCIKENRDENIECLDDAIHSSEAHLNKAYNTKLNKIKNTSPDEWWMGDEQQKKEVINAFIENQKKWIAYRDSFCGVALWPYQNSNHLGEAQTSCEINMNERRIEEINLILISSGNENENQ